MRDIFPVDQWFHSQMHNESAQDTAKRVLLQSCYTVANTLMHTYPTRVERNHGVISVFANVDILTGHVVVPLFVRWHSSIVMEGDRVYRLATSVPVEVKWTEAAPSSQLPNDAAMDHSITCIVTEEVRMPKKEWEAEGFGGLEDLHPLWLIKRDRPSGKHNCEMEVRGFKQCSSAALQGSGTTELPVEEPTFQIQYPFIVNHTH